MTRRTRARRALALITVGGLMMGRMAHAQDAPAAPVAPAPPPATTETQTTTTTRVETTTTLPEVTTLETDTPQDIGQPEDSGDNGGGNRQRNRRNLPNTGGEPLLLTLGGLALAGSALMLRRKLAVEG